MATSPLIASTESLYDLPDALSKLGYQSVFDIVRVPRERFIRQHRDTLGRRAGPMYDLAAGYAHQVAHRYRHPGVGRVLNVIPQGPFSRPGPDYPSQFLKADIGWKDRAPEGAPEANDGPAAYLTYIYGLALKQEKVGSSSINSLQKRRPDLGSLVIDEAAMNQVIPQIQLVNEVLASAIQHANGLSSVSAVNQLLAGQRYPNNLPYHYGNQQIRVAEATLDVCLSDCLLPQDIALFQGYWAPETALSSAQAADLARLQVMASQLGPEAQRIVTEPAFFGKADANAADFYARNFGDSGLSADALSVVDTLTAHAGLTASQVSDMFCSTAGGPPPVYTVVRSPNYRQGGEAAPTSDDYGARFINAGQGDGVYLSQDMKTMDLLAVNLSDDRVDRLNRIVRLQKWTGLPFEDVDLLVTSAMASEAGGNASLLMSDNTLRTLGVFKRYQQDHGVTAKQFAAWIDVITPFAITPVTPLLDQVFNSGGTFDAPLVVDDADFYYTALTGDDAARVKKICAALRLTHQQFLMFAVQVESQQSDGGDGRLKCTLSVLSAFYRLASLAQVLGMSPEDFCAVVALLDQGSGAVWGQLAGRPVILMPQEGAALASDILTLLGIFSTVSRWLQEENLSARTAAALAGIAPDKLAPPAPLPPPVDPPPPGPTSPPPGPTSPPGPPTPPPAPNPYSTSGTYGSASSPQVRALSVSWSNLTFDPEANKISLTQTISFQPIGTWRLGKFDYAFSDGVPSVTAPPVWRSVDVFGKLNPQFGNPQDGTPLFLSYQDALDDGAQYVIEFEMAHDAAFFPPSSSDHSGSTGPWPSAVYIEDSTGKPVLRLDFYQDEIIAGWTPPPAPPGPPAPPPAPPGPPSPPPPPGSPPPGYIESGTYTTTSDDYIANFSIAWDDVAYDAVKQRVTLVQKISLRSKSSWRIAGLGYDAGMLIEVPQPPSWGSSQQFGELNTAFDGSSDLINSGGALDPDVEYVINVPLSLDPGDLVSMPRPLSYVILDREGNSNNPQAQLSFDQAQITKNWEVAHEPPPAPPPPPPVPPPPPPPNQWPQSGTYGTGSAPQVHHLTVTWSNLVFDSDTYTVTLTKTISFQPIGSWKCEQFFYMFFPGYLKVTAPPSWGSSDTFGVLNPLFVSPDVTPLFLGYDDALKDGVEYVINIPLQIDASVISDMTSMQSHVGVNSPNGNVLTVDFDEMQIEGKAQQAQRVQHDALPAMQGTAFQFAFIQEIWQQLPNTFVDGTVLKRSGAPLYDDSQQSIDWLGLLRNGSLIDPVGLVTDAALDMTTIVLQGVSTAIIRVVHDVVSAQSGLGDDEKAQAMVSLSEAVTRAKQTQTGVATSLLAKTLDTTPSLSELVLRWTQQTPYQWLSTTWGLKASVKSAADIPSAYLKILHEIGRCVLLCQQFSLSPAALQHMLDHPDYFGLPSSHSADVTFRTVYLLGRYADLLRQVGGANGGTEDDVFAYLDAANGASPPGEDDAAGLLATLLGWDKQEVLDSWAALGGVARTVAQVDAVMRMQQVRAAAGLTASQQEQAFGLDRDSSYDLWQAVGQAMVAGAGSVKGAN